MAVQVKPAAWEDRTPVRKILDSKLEELCWESSSSKSFIFREPRAPPKVNERANEPKMISIGPYHHGKDHLKAMEILKVQYLSNLLQRCDDLDSYIAVSMSMGGEARDCYAETVTTSSEEFVAMMILDGLFVVELFRNLHFDFKKQNNALFKQNLNPVIIAQDLLLLENQLPFFVLKKFADMTKLNGERIEEFFVKNGLHFFSIIEPGPVVPAAQRHLFTQDHKHLLGFVHDNWLPSSQELERYRLRLVDRKWDSYFIGSATELLDVGIRFKKGRGNSLFDIKFKRGQMDILTLIVNHDTERIFRNLIAYEQFNHGFNLFTDYARLMYCLIKHTDDVALLCDCGVIENWLGSNEEVANMVKNLNDYAYPPTYNFYYSDVFHNVNEHRRSNLWKVKLRQKYFHTPWDWVLTSIVAATVLILLSLVQTICSVIASFK